MASRSEGLRNQMDLRLGDPPGNRVPGEGPSPAGDSELIRPLSEITEIE